MDCKKRRRRKGVSGALKMGADAGHASSGQTRKSMKTKWAMERVTHGQQRITTPHQRLAHGPKAVAHTLTRKKYLAEMRVPRGNIDAYLKRIE